MVTFWKGRTVLAVTLLVSARLVNSNAGTGGGQALAPDGDHLSSKTLGSVDWRDSNGNVAKREGKINIDGSDAKGDGSGGESTHCPSNCGGHGDCVYAEGRYLCSCHIGYAGEDCSKSLCEKLNNCNGHGKCGLPLSESGKKPSFEDKGKIMEFMHKLAKSLSDPESYEMGKAGGLGCVCDPGFSGPMCETRTCAVDCGDNGSCVDGSCECKPGFTGQTCSTVTCAGNCNGQGFCEAGVCKCKEGFTGEFCEKGANGCPSKHGKECAGNGICNAQGQCQCVGLWVQPDCASLSCLSFCSGNGVCNNGTCACDPGYVGDACNHRGTSEAAELLGRNPECTRLLELYNITVTKDGESGGAGGKGDGCIDPKCSGHGVCVDGHTCRCDNGFGGEVCGKMTCPRACSGHGKCLASGKCKCTGSYAGVACNEKTCAGGCSGHGKCVDRECHCDPMWGGELCAIQLCPGETEQCTGHGDCKDGVCHCKGGWYGEKCDLVQCPTAFANLTCSGHGLCQMGMNRETPACKCIGHWQEPYQAKKMWTGPDCNTMVCPDPKCSGHGKCKSGRCECAVGFEGDGCHKVDDGKSGKEGRCTDSKECNGGICYEGHCHCKGIHGRYGSHCEKLVHPAS